MSLADRLREKQESRKKKEDELKDVAKIKAKLFREKEEKRRAEEEALRLYLANKEEADRLAAEAARQREIERKTKEYFEHDSRDRIVSLPRNPTYFGDFCGGFEVSANKKASKQTRNESWVPHGKGQFLLDDEVHLSGTFVKGVNHGNGMMLIQLEDGTSSKWEGEFKMGKVHGVGFVTDKHGVRREALARDNLIICYKDELVDGKQVEFDDATMRVVAESRKPRASIMFHVAGWKYRCHFNDEIRPRERDVVFSSLTRFKVLHHLPQIYHMSRFGVQTDPPVRYDYYDDVYGEGHGEPRLGITGGRRTAAMEAFEARALRPHQRLATFNKSDNVFESQFVGIGAAKEAEEAEKRKEQKKKQFAALIEKRRAEQEAEKKRLIEQEQQRILEEDTAKQKEAFAKKQEEDANNAKALQEALEAEARAFDAREGN